MEISEEEKEFMDSRSKTEKKFMCLRGMTFNSEDVRHLLFEILKRFKEEDDEEEEEDISDKDMVLNIHTRIEDIYKILLDQEEEEEEEKEDDNDFLGAPCKCQITNSIILRQLYNDMCERNEQLKRIEEKFDRFDKTVIMHLLK
jgi:hypothetical protein